MLNTLYNVIIHGDVTNTNGVLSNFSVGNYATLPQIYTFANYSWELNLKIITGEDITSNQGVLTPVAPNSGDQRDAVNVWVNEGKLSFHIADTISTKIYSEYLITVAPNTTYYIKATYKDNIYTVKYSTDGITYIDGPNSPITSTKTIWDCGQIWGFGTGRNIDRPFYGSVDLSGCNLTINNQIVWRGIITTNVTRIVNRHDTAANWTTINPVLALGEMGVETDTNKFKFGDGTTAWSELAYATSGSSGGSGTQLTSADGSTEYGELALGDTLAVSDGVLNANLDELGNEVNTLSSRVTTNEDNITKLQDGKQDKLTSGESLEISEKYFLKANNLNVVNYPDNIYANNQFTVSSTNQYLGFIGNSNTHAYYRPDTSITAMENIVKYGSILIPFEKDFVYVLPERGTAIGYMNKDIFIPVFVVYNSYNKYLTDYNNATGSATSQSISSSSGNVTNNRGQKSIIQLVDNAFIKTNGDREYYKYDISGIDFIQGKDLFICVAQYGEYYRTSSNLYFLHSDSPLKALKYSECNIGKFATTADLTTDAGTPNADAENLLDLNPIKQTVISCINPIPTKTSELINDSGFITKESSGTLIQKEIQFPLNLTSNGTLGGSTPSCTGSSYESNPDHPYYYAFKGATTSTPSSELWGPGSGSAGQYLILDCVTPIALQSFRWTNGGTDAERFPVIVFKGSNDNSTYTTLATYNTQNATDDSVTINNTTPYRYYKFEFPEAANWGKLGFISITGADGYDILNIGDGLEVTNNTLSVNTDTYTKNEVDTLLSEKQNKLTAGENITIEDNVISGTLPDNVITSDNISQNEYIKQLQTEITAIEPNLLEMMANAGIITNVVLSWGTQKPTTDGTNVTIYQGTKIVLPTGFDSNGRATNKIYTTTKDITVAPTSNVLLMSISGYTFNCGAFYNQPYQSVPENPLPNTWLYSKEDNKNYQYVASGPTYNQYTYTPILEVVKVDGVISKLILNDCPVMQGHLYNIQNT